MVKEKLNAMNVLSFILNTIAPIIVIILYIMDAIPDRNSQFAQWLTGIIAIPIYGIVMFALMVYTIIIEQRKTIVKGPIFFAHDFRVTYNDKFKERTYFSGNQDLPEKWKINILYTPVNDGDRKARFRYYVKLILYVEDKNGKPLDSIATQSSLERIDHTFFPTQDLQDQLCTFLFNEVKIAKGWERATINFIGDYKDHNKDDQKINFVHDIDNPNVQKI